jgi:hypothetical protein
LWKHSHGITGQLIGYIVKLQQQLCRQSPHVIGNSHSLRRRDAELIVMDCRAVAARQPQAFASVVEPLSEIMKKTVSIPYFARHLNNFCIEKRGFILQQMGAARRYRYRFTNPLMQPFVIIHALSIGLIEEEILNRFS